MPPLIKIESIAGENPVEIMQVSDGVLSIGREPENQIVVDSEVVSRRHGNLVAAGDYWVYCDLGSSNGSWINNVQIQSGRHYLLRNGDAIQLADCPLRISEVNSRPGVRDDKTVILVFYGDTFSGSFPLTADSVRFSIGGPGAHLVLEGETEQYGEILKHRNTNRLELSVFKVGALAVNGRVVETAVGLVDRDEVEIGEVRIVVADGRTAVYRESTKFQFDPNYKVGDLRGTSAFAGPSQSGHDSSWEHTPRKSSSRNFVFGQTSEQFDPSATVTAIPNQKLRPHSGYETHPAQRFSRPGAVLESDDEGGNEKVLIFLGAFLLVVVVGLLVFFFALKA